MATRSVMEHAQGRASVPRSRRSRPPRVDVLICGAVDRGDDAAPLAAADLLRGMLPVGTRLRHVGVLDVDDLLAIREGAGVVIVDAGTGVASGSIHELPLHGGLPSGTLRPRSAHALELPEVIGVADMVRGRPLVGTVLVVGGRQFGRGRPLSASVIRALPALARAASGAAERIRQAMPLAETPRRLGHPA